MRVPLLGCRDEFESCRNLKGLCKDKGLIYQRCQATCGTCHHQGKPHDNKENEGKNDRRNVCNYLTVALSLRFSSVIRLANLAKDKKRIEY